MSRAKNQRTRREADIKDPLAGIRRALNGRAEPGGLPALFEWAQQRQRGR